jgi:hypothetical protein
LPDLIVHDTTIGALTGTEVAVIATEWPEFKELDWARAADVMAAPLVIDGRRLLDPAEMRSLGFRYERVGSPSSLAAAEDGATGEPAPATVPGRGSAAS